MKKFLVFTRNTSLLKRSYFNVLKERSLLTKKPLEATDILVVGGDGTMLSAIRKYWDLQVPFAGLNFGHIGFLMNEPIEQTIAELIDDRTHSVSIKLLQADLYDEHGLKMFVKAFNDFYFERTGTQTANIKVTVDGKTRFNPLVCDGIVVSSQAGSTAYNASAGGQIVPIETEAMILTAVCPAIFHRWRSSILAGNSQVILEPMNIKQRPVRFVRDGEEIIEIIKAIISYSETTIELKFAQSQQFREKVLQLQF